MAGRALRPDDHDVLTTRDNIAAWTGGCGDALAALRLSQELLPDQARVLGPDHPDVLVTRNTIAGWTARSAANAGGEAGPDPDGPEGESKTSGS